MPKGVPPSGGGSTDEHGWCWFREKNDEVSGAVVQEKRHLTQRGEKQHNTSSKVEFCAEHQSALGVKSAPSPEKTRSSHAIKRNQRLKV